MESLFGDKRLDKRYALLRKKLDYKQSAIINELGDNKAEKESYYRFLKTQK